MRGNDQQAYDRGTSLFSPDGRIYQVEYAREAVSRGAPSVGVRAGDGVVLAALTQASSKLMEAESIEKIHKLDDTIGAASAGHVADARQLIDFARRMAQGNRLRYGEPVSIETLTKYVTDHIQENTQMGGTRPYGAALLIGGIDEGDTPRLFGADPSGTPNEWRASVIGGGRQEIEETLEDEWDEDMSVDAAVSLAVSALNEYADDLTAAGMSLATVTVDDGYRAYDVEDIEALLDEVQDEADEDADDAAGADE